jgi:GT2 family glycosyltransferase
VIDPRARNPGGVRVSVVIPTHSDAHLLRKSLPTLLNHPGESQIVVMNNNPSQDVRAAIGDHADDERVQIIEMGWEAGFARAINRGIREGSGEFVLFCNADLFPTPTYLSELVAFFDRRPEAGAAIGKILRYDLSADAPTDVIDTAGLVLTRQRRFMPRGEGEADNGRYNAEEEVFAIDGAALVARRTALEAAAFGDEYLDESFITHKEDHDISWRLRLVGWECWYVPCAVAYHARTTRGLGSTSYLSAIRSFHRNEQQKSRRVQVNAMKNQWLMLIKYEDRFNFVRDLPFILTRELAIAVHHLVFAPRSLAAVPMTLKLLPRTLSRRRAVKRSQVMDPRDLRRWLAPAPTAPHREGRLRIGVIVNMVAPYTKPLFECLARRDDCQLLVVSETSMERDRRWTPEVDLPFDHVLLDSWTTDLSRIAIGSGFRTRFDTYLYVPKRPLGALVDFAPDVVVAGGGGIWSSPANLAALAARGRHGWGVVPWWGSFTRTRPTLPRRLAEPWVKAFMRTSDAWLVYGSRQARDVVELGADPERVVVAPITAHVPEAPARERRSADGTTRYLFVGRLIERKGLDVLLEAFERVDGGELRIAGDGPLRETVEAAAARDPRIRLIGHVVGEPLASAYQDADVLVVPSLYEPWGLVVHEGLAHGLPVIVTDEVGAADDLVERDVNGYVVAAGSAEELAEAMTAVAAWTPARREAGSRRSADLLGAVSVERSAEGFVRGCRLALEHRRRTARTAA